MSRVNIGAIKRTGGRAWSPVLRLVLRLLTLGGRGLEIRPTTRLTVVLDDGDDGCPGDPIVPRTLRLAKHEQAVDQAGEREHVQ